MFNQRFQRPVQMVGMPMQDGMIDIENNTGNIDIDFTQMQTNSMNSSMMGPQAMAASPIMEPMRERVVNRVIEHVVPHHC